MPLEDIPNTLSLLHDLDAIRARNDAHIHHVQEEPMVHHSCETDRDRFYINPAHSGLTKCPTALSISTSTQTVDPQKCLYKHNQVYTCQDLTGPQQKSRAAQAAVLDATGQIQELQTCLVNTAVTVAKGVLGRPAARPRTQKYRPNYGVDPPGMSALDTSTHL